MKFKELTSNEEILRAIEELGFSETTPIQDETILSIKEGRDLIAQSQTGTGKTAAFAIPTIEMIDEELNKEQVLVMCPTRELAVQVSKEFKKLLKFNQTISVIAIFGGERIDKQIKELKKKKQIIVATPGRLRDHIRRRTIRLDTVNTVILDEADEMLKMGFVEEIEYIFSVIKNKTQNLMFSATISPNVERLASKYLDNPVKVKIEPKSIASNNVKQSYMAIKRKNKKSVIGRILDHKNPKKCIIFCNTKRMVDELILEMRKKGYSAGRIHGDLKQENRISTLNQFNNGNIDILIATDIAGRGLDIKNVDLVINYDLPEKEDSYVHRIGRSGRAGADGEAVTLVSSSDKRMLNTIQKYMKKDIKHDKVPSQKTVNSAKIQYFIDETLRNLDDNIEIQYSSVLNYIKEKGYSLEQIALSLLKDSLNFSDDNGADYNDHSFHSNNKEKERNRSSRRGNKPFAKRNANKSRNSRNAKNRFGSKSKSRVK